MKICILDGEKIEDNRMLHDTLASSLDFPQWYGRNLDALFDCLTDIGESVHIRILHENAMEEHLGRSYAISLANVICRAAEANPEISWEIEP